jgi:hypothetical protein
MRERVVTKVKALALDMGTVGVECTLLVFE